MARKQPRLKPACLPAPLAHRGEARDGQPKPIGLPVESKAETTDHHPVGVQDYPERKPEEADALPAKDEDTRPLERI